MLDMSHVGSVISIKEKRVGSKYKEEGVWWVVWGAGC